MIILDTDISSLLDRQSGEAFENFSRRFAATSEEEQVFTTIVSFEEQTRGWLSQIRLARKPEAAASARCAELQRQRVRVGTMDLRIAAIALTKDALLISRNLRDFRHVPGLRVEDWTQPE